PVAVPLVPPPPPPPTPHLTYDEKAISVMWDPVASGAPIQAPATGDELPSTAIGQRPLVLAYNVYDVAQNTSNRLTKSPVAETTFSDPRIVWGEERCYSVRTVETIGGLSIESDAAAPACTTLKDTFAPAAPARL